MANINIGTKDLVITREFNAPVELVWRAWTEPEYYKRWWGPKDFTAPVSLIDLRIGGKYLSAMRSPEGQDFYSAGIFKEIVPLKKLVYTDSFADENGNMVSAAHYGMDPDFPLVTEVTVTFEDLGGSTRLTLRHTGMPAGELGEQAGAGWNESFDKLAASVETA